MKKPARRKPLSQTEPEIHPGYQNAPYPEHPNLTASIAAQMPPAAPQPNAAASRTPKTPKVPLPDHLSPERLAAEPLVFEKGLSLSGLRLRFFGGVRIGSITSSGIRGYNATMPKEHHMTRRRLEIILARSGYDYKLAHFLPEETPEAAPVPPPEPSTGEALAPEDELP